MVVYKTPGVYKEEVFLRSQSPLPTGIPAFIGFADAIASLDVLPLGIQFPASLQDRIRYESSSKRLVFTDIMTVENQDALLALSGAVPLNTLPSEVQFPDTLSPRVQYDASNQQLVFRGVMQTADRILLLTLSSDIAFTQAVESLFMVKLAYQQAIATLFQNAQRVVALYRRQEFTSRPGEEFTSKLLSLPESYLTEVVNGFFENGGLQCFVVRAMPGSNWETALTDPALFKALEGLDDLDLVAIPDAMSLRLSNQLPDTNAMIRVQQAVLQHCAVLGDRMAILDALPSSTPAAVIAQGNQLIANLPDPINGALYYPWLKNTQSYPGNLSQAAIGRLVPPCGHVAGIFALTDRERGVFKAPANVEIQDAIDLELSIDNTLQNQLNPMGINCLRAFPGRGIRVWGARTLSRDINWRYINVRRIFLTLGRWIAHRMVWATFEPTSPRLWIRIQRELSTYLIHLWQQGALQGATPGQAFYVKCDAETNPPEQQEAGQVVTEIGLAATSTAEFIVVRIVHRAGATEIAR